MPVLHSYVSGQWTAPADGWPVRDAVTGEEVARISSAGTDLGAALEYGRRVGGPALRELTFHDRAALAKAIGGRLRAGDELTVTLTCKQISPRDGDYGEVRWDAEVIKQDGSVAVTYDVLTMVAKEWSR